MSQRTLTTEIHYLSSALSRAGKYQSIAAASILAKTFRDDYMMGLHAQYPAYHWDSNKGYPTRDHRSAIATHGISPYHRRSFHLRQATQLKIDFDGK